jgi:energy-coupling factor transporter ATP-binding protein EcfA2
MSYFEKGYHKEGDKPFSFPPTGIDSKISANLIEIEGRNGSGKTTLLNCLALAMGYLDHEKDLETKPALKQKLQNLCKNPTLEYYFRICCEKPEPIDLIIERLKGQVATCCLNDKYIDLDVINRKFDVVFLTEDDPKKVVNASIGKLSKYFNELEKGVGSLQSVVIKYLRKIDEFNDFKKKEADILKDIDSCSNEIKIKKHEHEKLVTKLKQLEMKNEIKGKLKLLNEERQITSEYNDLKKKYDQVKDKKDADIIRSLYKERSNLDKVNAELNKIDDQIKTVCDSLDHHGIRLDKKKLLQNDYGELNELNKRMQPKKKEETIKLRMIDDLTTLFNQYLDNDIVPLNNKTVRETRSDLLRLKAQLAADRVFALLTTLNNIMNQKMIALSEFDKVQDKIVTLSNKSKALKEIEDIQKAYMQAEERYLALQVIRGENREALLSKWHELSLIDGDPVGTQHKVHELEISKETQETLLIKYKEKLRLLQENSTAKPRCYEKETQLKSLYGAIFKLRENTAQWTGILDNPELAKNQFDQEEKSGFGLSEYAKFVKAVGEYLGSQFEPIPFDYRQHDVKFFDIERNVFITAEDREIHIANLSQGQSKITSLTGSFKKMDPSKKKIVLIDEISELDPQNLEDVKKTLKQKLDEGSLLLAVLARPSSEMTRIKGWG